MVTVNGMSYEAERKFKRDLIREHVRNMEMNFLFGTDEPIHKAVFEVLGWNPRLGPDGMPHNFDNSFSNTPYGICASIEGYIHLTCPTFKRNLEIDKTMFVRGFNIFIDELFFRKINIAIHRTIKHRLDERIHARFFVHTGGGNVSDGKHR